MENLTQKLYDFNSKFDKFNDDILLDYFSFNLNAFIEEYINERKYFDLASKLEKRIEKQIIFEQKIKNLLMVIDQYEIPVIVMKGCFLKQKYYKNNFRYYGDLDLFVQPKNSYKLYLNLKDENYEIKDDSFLLYNNKTIFTLLKGLYAKNVHSIDMEKKVYIPNGLSMIEKDILKCPIDLMCNLNVDTNCNFDNVSFFNNSQPFSTYKNIKQLNEYHNILFLIHHIMRHLSFYKYDSKSISINIQKISDIAFIIENLGHQFEFARLIQMAKEYKVLPDVLFFFNIYNKMFFYDNYYNINPYYEEVSEKECHWKFILHKTRKMSAEDILVGNYSDMPEFMIKTKEIFEIKSQCHRIYNMKKCISYERKKYESSL